MVLPGSLFIIWKIWQLKENQLGHASYSPVTDFLSRWEKTLWHQKSFIFHFIKQQGKYTSSVDYVIMLRS